MKYLFAFLIFHIFWVGEARAQTNIIKDIIWNADSEADLARLSDLLGFKVGEDFSYSKLDIALRNLAETTLFDGVRGTFFPETGYVEISLTLVERLASTEILLSPRKGEDVPDYLKSNLVDVLGFSVGDPIRLDMLDTVKDKVTKRLEERGYLSSKTVVLLEETRETKYKRLVVSSELGPRAFVRALHLKGFSTKDYKELLKYLKNLNEMTGKENIQDMPLDQNLEQRLEVVFAYDTLAITETFSKWAADARAAGYYDFQVKLSTLDNVGPDENSLELSLRLSRGLKYDVQFSNNTLFWERDLRAKVLDRSLRLGVPFSPTDAETLILNIYKTEGYADVKIKTSVKEESDKKIIEFVVDEGPRLYLGDVHLLGPAVDEMGVLTSVSSQWLESFSSPWHKTYYDEKKIKGLIPDLMKMIRNLGYLQVRVLESRFVRDPSSKSVDLNINLQLGERYPIRSITVLGNIFLSDDELSKIIQLSPGDIANPDQVKDIAMRLESAYKELGFINAFVSLDESVLFKYSVDSTAVDIEYTLQPGPRVVIGKILVQGTKRAKDVVVLRELEQVALVPGKVLTPIRMSAAEERLLGLGLFNAVRVKTLGGSLIKNDETKNAVQIQEKDLGVEVGERPAGALEFGPGFRTNLGLIGFAELNYRNLGGLNRSVILRTQVSRKLKDYQFLEQDYSITFLEPYFLKFPLRLRLGLNYEKKDEIVFSESHEKVNGFNREEVSFSIGFEKELTRSTRLFVNAFTLSLPRFYDIVRIDAAATQTNRIGSVGAVLTYDKRDNVFNPGKGFISSSTVEYSGPVLGSDTNANYILAKQIFSKYTPIIEGVVWALSLSYARLWALGEVEGLPLSKRLKLGGLNSIRSLKANALSFTQEGVQREESMELKTELRQPMILDLGLAYFFDIGQVNAYEFGKTGFRKSAGVGFRYTTPVGPLSLDFAFNIDARPDEDKFKVQFSIGNF